MKEICVEVPTSHAEHCGVPGFLTPMFSPATPNLLSTRGNDPITPTLRDFVQPHQPQLLRCLFQLCSAHGAVQDLILPRGCCCWVSQTLWSCLLLATGYIKIFIFFPICHEFLPISVPGRACSAKSDTSGNAGTASLSTASAEIQGEGQG